MIKVSAPAVATDYDRVKCQIEEMIEAERPIVSQWGATRLLSHGHCVRNALVIFHGFTNCPRQCVAIGERFFDLGYNVFIPRLPQHGLADRLTRDLKHIKANDLYTLAKTSADWAHGLGERVIVAGLSLGGLMAAWLALRRSDIDLAVLAAPGFGAAFLPPFVARALTWLVDLLPDFYVWWDPRTKAENPESYPFAYPGFPSHGFARLLAMGNEVGDLARADMPAARRVLFITIGGDPAVNNAQTHQIAGLWQERAPGVVSTFEFDRSYAFPHDIITPESPRSRVDVVYPKLVELITGLVDKV